MQLQTKNEYLSICKYLWNSFLGCRNILITRSGALYCGSPTHPSVPRLQYSFLFIRQRDNVDSEILKHLVQLQLQRGMSASPRKDHSKGQGSRPSPQKGGRGHQGGSRPGSLSTASHETESRMRPPSGSTPDTPRTPKGSSRKGSGASR